MFKLIVFAALLNAGLMLQVMGEGGESTAAVQSNSGEQSTPEEQLPLTKYTWPVDQIHQYLEVFAPLGDSGKEIAVLTSLLEETPLKQGRLGFYNDGLELVVVILDFLEENVENYCKIDTSLNRLLLAVRSLSNNVLKTGAERTKALLIKCVKLAAENCLAKEDNPLLAAIDEKYQEELTCVDDSYFPPQGSPVYDFERFSQIFENRYELTQAQSNFQKCKGDPSDSAAVWEKYMIEPCKGFLNENAGRTILQPAVQIGLAINALSTPSEMVDLGLGNVNHNLLLKWASRRLICNLAHDPYDRSN